MKNTILKISSIIAGSIIILLSCKKNDTTLNNQGQANEAKFTSSTISIEGEDLTSEMLNYVDTLILTDVGSKCIKTVTRQQQTNRLK